MAIRRAPNEFHEELGVAIHDLCQPLTTLRCRLELVMMEAEPAGAGLEELREAVGEALQDVRRTFDSIELMRQLLLVEMKLRP